MHTELHAKCFLAALLSMRNICSWHEFDALIEPHWKRTKIQKKPHKAIVSDSVLPCGEASH